MTNQEEELNSLEERIKELSCLYEVTSLASDKTSSFDETIQAIVNRIPKAWRYPDDAVCVLRLNDNYWQSQAILQETVSHTQVIFIEDSPVGSLTIHYPANKRSKNDFLIEELALQDKLAKEISNLLDRKIRKEREDAFIVSVQRQDRLSILGEIAAGIAHELNTPLGNILGFTQLIQSSEISVQTKNDTDKIIQSVLYAREVVKKLMFFSCELPQRFVQTCIPKLISDALKLIVPTCREKEINIIFSTNDDDFEAQVDSIQLTQVIFNILLNAIHASPKKSKIELNLQLRSESFNLLISDQGSGIPQEIQERIFDPFFTTKDIGEGSGLGLSVVHGIIKAHKGCILVASSPGEGTTFSIEIPLKQH